MITEALKCIAACLSEADIPYMVIGGQAVAQYGEVRYTQDIDVTLALTPDESQKVVGPLLLCGFSLVADNYISFLNETWVLPVEHSATKTKIDLTFSILPFERKAIDDSKEILVDNIPVKYITCEDLVIQKIFAGRPRDIQDVESILRLKKGKVNLEKIRAAIESLSEEIADSSLLDRLNALTEFFR